VVALVVVLLLLLRVVLLLLRVVMLLLRVVILLLLLGRRILIPIRPPHLVTTITLQFHNTRDLC